MKLRGYNLVAWMSSQSLVARLDNFGLLWGNRGEIVLFFPLAKTLNVF